MNSACILQVEDDENDVFFLNHAFQKEGLCHALHVVADGQEAIDYLSGTGLYKDRALHPLPLLVLLDLKLPRTSGLEVLRWIRQQPVIHSMIVIIFSSSSQTADVQAAYELGANSFVVKPTSLESRLHFAASIKAFWFTHNVFNLPIAH